MEVFIMKKLMDKYFKGMNREDIALRIYLFIVILSFGMTFMTGDGTTLVGGITLGIVPAFLIAEIYGNNNKD